MDTRVTYMRTLFFFGFYEISNAFAEMYYFQRTDFFCTQYDDKFSIRLFVHVP